MSTGYLKIRINSLHASQPLTFDLFVSINGRYVLYVRAGDSLDGSKIKTFEHKGADIFYILEADRFKYKNYVHSQVSDESLGTKQRALILKESSFSLVEELFEHPDVNVALNQSKDLISEFVTFIDQEPEAIAHLIGLSSHDFYTYNHSLDVSIYALGLGQVVGYDKKELADLGLGSLLHDIGKRHVSADIICKKGPLDEAEWAQMKMHPTFGLKILNENPDMSDNVKACAFEHHENWAGNGYPQELPGPEIHLMACIVALTDTYDALTTKRSYNEPMKPTDALTLMKDKLSGRFNPDLLKAMYSVLFRMNAA